MVSLGTALIAFASWAKTRSTQRVSPIRSRSKQPSRGRRSRSTSQRFRSRATAIFASSVGQRRRITARQSRTIPSLCRSQMWSATMRSYVACNNYKWRNANVCLQESPFFIETTPQTMLVIYRCRFWEHSSCKSLRQMLPARRRF